MKMATEMCPKCKKHMQFIVTKNQSPNVFWHECECGFKTIAHDVKELRKPKHYALIPVERGVYVCTFDGGFVWRIRNVYG